MSRSDGTTGHLREEEVLGACSAVHREWLPWQKAMELVRKNQPRAKTAAALLLEKELRKEFGVTLSYYTAVRSTLDRIHSVDAFIEYKGVVVTMDFTTNPDKDSCKAHILGDEDDVANIAVLAGRVARELRSQLSRRA